jgi:hypothetical protein
MLFWVVLKFLAKLAVPNDEPSRDQNFVDFEASQHHQAHQDYDFQE